MGAIQKETFCLESLEKSLKGKKHPYLDFATRMKLLSVCPNIEWKLLHKWVMIWFSKASKDTNFNKTFRKYQKFAKKLHLICQTSRFKTDSNQKHTFFGLFETNRSVADKHPNKRLNIFAGSEQWILYRRSSTLTQRSNGLNLQKKEGLVCGAVQMLRIWHRYMYIYTYGKN